MAEYKVLITTSGIGSRMGALTQHTNKSLIPIGDRAALSHIIELYPEDIEIVITTGYFGQHVTDFVCLAYPNRNISFISIEPYQGYGSSLLYSMLQAKEMLQCPFVYHACDTVIIDCEMPVIEYNWMMGCIGSNSSDYRSFQTGRDDTITRICEKGEPKYDYLYVGVAGIKDWQAFWAVAESTYDPTNASLSDCSVLSKLVEDGHEFKALTIPSSSWLDIGNVKSFHDAQKVLVRSFDVLDKEDESLHVFNEFVIKFFANSDIVQKRVERANNYLKGLVPPIVGTKQNFYKYPKVCGKVLSEVVNERIFDDFLNWAKDNLWKVDNFKIDESFKETCHDFYFTKTLDRISKFEKITNRRDKDGECINGVLVPSVRTMLNSLQPSMLETSICYPFHGDCILDNIIYNNGSFTLIDWRQDFGGNLAYGDIYYDLAKLNHNLVFNHAIVSKGQYEISIGSSNIQCDILRKDLFCSLQENLFRFIDDTGFYTTKVKILTPLIWINMSPLHTYPLNLFLYYFGRYNLWKQLTSS